MSVAPVEAQREVLLEVEDLVMEFGSRGLFKRDGGMRAVDGVTLTLYRGETLALVGESGCGKSTLARCILRVHKPQEGSVRLHGQDVLGASAKQLRELRRNMTVILQDPTSSMNPRMRVRDVVSEPLVAHGYGTKAERRERVDALLGLVGLDPSMADRYPHEFSGGQRQRIAIARALALSPDLIICDESVAALDVSIRAQVINLLEDLHEQTGVSYLFISHDLSVAYHMADRVAVMYLGRIVEIGSTADVLERPHHPYTRLLIDAVPVPDPDVELAKRGQSAKFTREASQAAATAGGCAFLPRCPIGTSACAESVPPLVDLGDGHLAACPVNTHPLPPGWVLQMLEEKSEGGDRVLHGGDAGDHGNLSDHEHRGAEEQRA
jgi:oligopeptide/dipeptide ABC transporter ATP-binding protein